jgi:hypothetical protein
MTLVHSPSAHTQPGSAKTVADILTAAQVGLLLDVEARGPIHGLLFSAHRSAGPSLRELDLLTGFGQDVHLTKAGRAAAEKARAAAETGAVGTERSEVHHETGVKP